MLRKSTLLAVAASAALGLAMLSPNVALAKGGHGGHGGHGSHGIHHGGLKFHGGLHHRRHAHGHWHRHWCGRHPWRCHRPVWYYPRPVVYAAKPYVPGPCTCLSKQYTPEGAVVFRDNCTNEMAMNPPAMAPTAELAPQQTPQTAYAPVQPQVQYAPQYPPQATMTAPVKAQ